MDTDHNSSETSKQKRHRLKITPEKLEEYQQRIMGKSLARKTATLEATRHKGDPSHFYDDDVVTAISEEMTDRLTVIPVLGDLIRFLGGVLRRRPDLTAEEFIQRGLDLLFAEDVHRRDIANLTRISSVDSNLVVPFMNGGPAGENWDNSQDGFFDWIDNKSNDSILGVELGFKADDYGQRVAGKLIQKKKSNPNMYIGILIDGFVSIIMQKLPKTMQAFEQNTLAMIKQMSDAGIDVIVNSSFDPFSDDFFAANHIKLWVFDARIAFFGGIGIETQFQTRMYDEMDMTQGQFVNVLSLIALLLMKSQRSYDNPLLGARKHDDLTRDSVLNRFIRKPETSGNIKMTVEMDVPGYVQDARNEYVRLLSRTDIQEIYLIAPYFSNHKVARALVRTAEAMNNKFGVAKQGARIHVIFPTKQENMIIADVSKYYAHYLRNNPIVETLEYQFQEGDQSFDMLHAKQLVLVLNRPSENWTKYVKFGGSYNPAGRAQNMWELNAVQIMGEWKQSDEGPGAPSLNPIRDYLNNVVRVLVKDCTRPFPWGQVNYKLSITERLAMFIAKSLWF